MRFHNLTHENVRKIILHEKLHPTIAPPPRHGFLNLPDLGTLAQVHPHAHMFTVLNPLYRHLLISYPVKHKRVVRRSPQMQQRLGADLILTFKIYIYARLPIDSFGRDSETLSTEKWLVSLRESLVWGCSRVHALSNHVGRLRRFKF